MNEEDVSTRTDSGNPGTNRMISFLSSSLNNVSKGELEELEDSMFWVQYSKGDLIAQEGSLSSSVYIVYDGLVKIGKYSDAKQNQRVLRFLGPKEWFGLEVVFMPNQNTDIQFSRAVLDSELISIETSRFKEFLHQHPEALYDLCVWFAREVAMLEFKLTREAADGALQNFAVLLLGLDEKYGEEEGNGSKIDLKLPRHTLADLMGVSVETLRRLIKRLKEAGAISTKDHKITVQDRNKLHELAGVQDFYLTILSETL